jgi:hypothetical protein
MSIALLSPGHQPTIPDGGAIQFVGSPTALGHSNSTAEKTITKANKSKHENQREIF